MKPYEKYKESGVEWIGEIPEHWNNLRIKYLVNGGDTLFIDGNWIESDIITEDGIRYLTSGNIGPGFYKEQGNGFVSEDTFISNNFTEVFPGDLLISRLNEPIGRACIIPDLGNRIVTCVDNVILRPKTTIDKRYLMFLMNSKEYSNVTSLISRGATMKRISRSLLGQIKIPIPPKAEQTSIAKYLDHQTAIIDELIEKKTKQIALLKEKRQAIINETVTKGLDPTAKMKDSGIDGGDHRWLGEIPESWETTPLKHLATLKGRLGWKGLKADEYVPEGFGFLSTPDIKGDKIDFNSINYITEERYLESPEIMLEVGDVLLVKDGSTLGITNIIKELPIPSTVNSSIAVIRINDTEKLLPEYLLALLSSNALQTVVNKLKAGQGVPHLFQKDIKNFLILIPALGEQKKIVEHIEGLKEKVSTIIRKSESQIEKLKEYRQSLISEAVTGKIDVRGWQKN